MVEGRCREVAGILQSGVRVLECHQTRPLRYGRQICSTWKAGSIPVCVDQGKIAERDDSRVGLLRARRAENQHEAVRQRQTPGMRYEL